MANASYNTTSVNSKPAILQIDSRLTRCVVRTTEGAPEPVVNEYALAGLSGRGSIATGHNAAGIRWTMTFVATWDNWRAFQRDIFAHQSDPVRARLTSETGEYWDYVELRRHRLLKRQRMNPLSAQETALYYFELEIEFRWMQPG